MSPPRVCPKCGCPVRPRVWYEERYIVEYLFRCQCGYGENWSYGTYFDLDDPDDEED